MTGRPRIGISTSAGELGYGPVHAAEASYVDAVVAAGGMPVIVPALTADLAPEVVASLDGLLLSGGGDVEPGRYGATAAPEVYGTDPVRDEWELALAAAAAGSLPTLGICRGAQVLNVARGGTLVQHLPHRTQVEHRDRDRSGEEVHQVDLAEGSLVRHVLGVASLRANTLHHQSVDELGGGLLVVGWADDGTIEAIEAFGEPVIGVQWHPELLVDRPPHRLLFSWLVDAARR